MLRLQATQKSMLLFQKLNPGVNAYHRSTAIEINGNIDLPCFKAALIAILDRHKTLRCVIEDTDEPYLKEQEKLKTTPTWPLKFIDAQNKTASLANLTETLAQLGEKNFIEAPFDLQNGPLWRAMLIRLSENKYHFTMFFHHIIVDETSLAIIYRDFAEMYNSLLEQKPTVLHNISKFETYDIEIGEQERLTRLRYWKNNLQDLSNLSLQTDFPESDAFQFIGKRTSFHLDNQIIQKLSNISKNYKVSLNSTLLTSLYSLLSRLSNENDICIGITSANRRHPNIPTNDVDHLVNSFFNSVPLRFNYKSDSKITDLLIRIHNTVRDGLKNQLPLDTIFNEAISPDSKPSFSTASPFKVLFVLNAKKQPITLTGATVSEPQELDLGRSKFPYFGINLDEQEDGSYKCFVEYNTQLFKHSTIDNLIQRFVNTLHYFSNNLDATIGSIPYFLENEIVLLENFNHYEPNPAFEKFIPEIFSDIAKSHPEHEAIVFHDTRGNRSAITYATLDKLSNQLANHILSLPATNSNTIGLGVTRSINLIIAVIAILKSGKTIVPLETSLSEIINHKLKETRTHTIITDNNTFNLFNDFDGTLLNLSTNEYKKYTDSHPKSQIKGSDFAYITYTSGTTSITPSGADNSHASLVNLFYALKQRMIAPHSRVICTALPTFDAFFFDLLVGFATSGEVHLSDEESRFNPDILDSIIKKEKINYGVFLPSILNHLDLNYKLHIVSMGSNPNKKNLDERLAANPEMPIEIGYGLTEAGICSSLQVYDPNEPQDLIGKPIPNTYMYVLNPNDFSECPIGMPGQIFLAGINLASGYINHPELSKEKFIEMAFDRISRRFIKPELNPNLPVIRLCATGDYGCYWLCKNELVIKFLGRKDRQIKLLSGVRLELNTIENILRQHPAISDVVVVTNETKSALNAYIVPKNPHSNVLSNENLVNSVRSFLVKTSLPMIAHPKGLALIDKLPITANGKVDLKALRKIESQQRSPLPENLTPIQTELIKLWMEVLENPHIAQQIDLDTAFEFLGGSSLKLFTLIEKIKKSDYFKLNTDEPLIITKAINIRKLEDMLINIMTAKRLFADKLSIFSKTIEPKITLTVSSDLIFDDQQSYQMNKH